MQRKPSGFRYTVSGIRLCNKLLSFIKADNHAIVLDCGTGLYGAAPYLEGCQQVDVLMTHLHYDHILGLLGWTVFPKNAQVRVYMGVPHDSDDFNLLDFLKTPYWPVSPEMIDAIGADYDSTLHLTERASARFCPSNHPDNAAIIRVDTDTGSACLICDWEHGDREVPSEMVRGCSLILYDGMFNEAEYQVCKGWGHSTWNEGVKLAQQYGVERLVITHHLPERSDEQLHQMEDHARQVYPGIRFAREGDAYSLEHERKK
ncbi:MAG: MBL fold metallo-hydrolase [Clostridiales bacterium]|nr:MBL fold metallo-hydrolase [Clostridiales bacterium]